MPIIHHEHTDGYTIIPNKAIHGLSLKSVGLLALMLSLPDDWVFSETGLASIAEHDGLCAIRSAVKELTDAGYIQKGKQNRSASGKMESRPWVVSDAPIETVMRKSNNGLEQSTVIRFSVDGKTVNGKPHTNKINNNKVNIICDHKKETEKVKRFTRPAVSDVAAYASEMGYSDFDAERFVDYYESKGWKVGRTPMKDWKAAVRNWQRNSEPKEAEPDYYAGTGWTQYGRE